MRAELQGVLKCSRLAEISFFRPCLEKSKNILVAYGPEEVPVVAEEMPLEQLQSWSHEQQLHCSNCCGVVHVRGGPSKRMQLHFAHQRGETHHI